MVSNLFESIFGTFQRMRLYLILCRIKKGTFIKTNYKNKIQIQNPQQHNKTHNNNLTPKNHSLP